MFTSNKIRALSDKVDSLKDMLRALGDMLDFKRKKYQPGKHWGQGGSYLQAEISALSRAIELGRRELAAESIALRDELQHNRQLEAEGQHGEEGHEPSEAIQDAGPGQETGQTITKTRRQSKRLSGRWHTGFTEGR